LDGVPLLVEDFVLVLDFLEVSLYVPDPPPLLLELPPRPPNPTPLQRLVLLLAAVLLPARPLVFLGGVKLLDFRDLPNDDDDDGVLFVERGGGGV